MSTPPAEQDIVQDEDSLLRRVANSPNMMKREGEVTRPSSAAFKPHDEDGAVSVDIRKLLVNPGEPMDVLAELPEHGLVEIYAGKVREVGLDVVHQPLPQNPAHGNIVGLQGMGKSGQRRAQRELALAAVWVCQPRARA